VSISSTIYTIGAAAQTIAAPDDMAQRVTITNLQPGQSVGEMSRDGYVFLAQSRFSISNNGTAHLQITTGQFGAQFEFYEIVAAGFERISGTARGSHIRQRHSRTRV